MDTACPGGNTLRAAVLFGQAGTVSLGAESHFLSSPVIEDGNQRDQPVYPDPTPQVRGPRRGKKGEPWRGLCLPADRERKGHPEATG